LGQASNYTVIAEKGDGIFSMLRKEGLNPPKYYAKFVELNSDNLRNGSELHLGRVYKIPYSEDSYKKKAIQVLTEEKQEESIFTSELANISAKSDKLKDAVIFLISGNNPQNISKAAEKVAQEINYNLAQELMVHGAQVYFIQSESLNNDALIRKQNSLKTEGAMAGLYQMQDYVETINKKYLKHHGKYQRLIVTRVNNAISDKYCEVSVYHHTTSEKGKNIASNIQKVFNKNSVQSKSIKDYTDVFTDKSNLYLAKNALPAITLIDIGNDKKLNIGTVTKVKSDRTFLSNLIASGIQNDYTDLMIEE